MNIGPGDVAAMAKLAWQLYNLGFSRAQNADRLYADFGQDVQHLAQGLDKLNEVISKVTQQLPRSMKNADFSWELESTKQIIGNFQRTINDCAALLRNQAAFDTDRNGFIRNVRWNLTIQPDVVRLRQRLDSHNVKIVTILKPLELKLVLDLRGMLYRIDGRISNMQETLDRIERLVRTTAGLSIQEPSIVAQDMEVPEYIENRLAYAFTSKNRELQERGSFPLVQGIDAFHRHFSQSTAVFRADPSAQLNDIHIEQSPDPTQYLNLMKAIWINRQIRAGYEFTDASVDNMWPCYVNELERKCRRECARFTTREPARTRLKQPDMNSFFLLGDDEFNIDLMEPVIEESEESPDAAGSMDEILRVPLASRTANRRHELVLLRRGGVDDRLSVHSLSSNNTAPRNPEKIISEIDLKTVHMLPLYANPNATELNIVLKPDAHSGDTTIFSFLKLEHLLKFQRAITEYNIVNDKKDVQTQIYMSSGLFSKKALIERGRVQIWYRRPLDRASERRFSQATKATSSSRSTNGSIKTFSTSYTSPIVTDTVRSFNFQLPKLPILMLYLESSAQQLSFLSIQMDQLTSIEGGRCECERNSTSCTHTYISRAGGLLYERRVAINRGDWNLAGLGKWQMRSERELERERELKMHWLLVGFLDPPAKRNFEDEFRQTRVIWQRQMDAYVDEMRRAQEDVGV